MSETDSAHTSTKKVVNLDAPEQIEETMSRPKPDVTAPVEQPVEQAPVENASTALASADIVNKDPVEPVAPYAEPVAKTEVEHEQPSPTPVAEEKEPVEAGTDELLEQIRKPHTSEKPSSGDDEQIDLIYNQVVMGKRSELIDDMRKIYPTDDDVRRAASDDDSFFNAVTNASVNGWNTGSSNSIGQVLECNDHVGNRLVHQGDLGDVNLRDGQPSKIKHHDQLLSGKQARLAIQARLGGIIRVMLLNSGFWVVLRAPHAAELQEIFATLDVDGKEIGRSLGMHFALISDLYLKKKFCEVIVRYKLIQESNFLGINEPGALFRNLSFHDYDALMHGILTLMTRRGLRARLVCPKCQTVSVEQKLDVGGMKFLNRDLVTDKFKNWWNETVDASGKPVVRTEHDLERYRDEVLGFKSTITQMIDVGYDDDKVRVDLDLAVPTMSTYFTVGERLIALLNNTVTAIANGEAEKTDLVKASLAIHGFQLLAPWIREMRVYKEDGVTVDIRTLDNQTIVDYLDSSVQQNADNTEIFDKLNQFVADSRFNYFGSCSIECPHCHAKPESGLDNFFALDMQMVFFGLLFRRLGAAS